MTSVVGFWWFPEEEQEFVAYLTKAGPLVGYAQNVVRDPGLIIPVAFDSVMASGASSVLFTQEPYADLLKVDAGADAKGACYSASILKSSYISYSRGKPQTGNRLGMSNLNAAAKYFDENARVVEKPLGFVKWYKRVFGWVRAHTPHFHKYKTYRISERVAKAIDEGWELVP